MANTKAQQNAMALDPKRAMLAKNMSVMPGGPGAVAGLEVNDVIVSVAGQAVRNPAEVVTAIDRSGVGQPLILSVQRQGKQLPVTVRPVEMRALKMP